MLIALIDLAIRTTANGASMNWLFLMRRRHTSWFRELADKQHRQYAEDYARSLVSLGNRLSSLGCFEEAEEHTRQALRIYQDIAIKNFDNFDLNYASILNNIGNAFIHLGRYEESFKYRQEALEINRRLADKNLSCTSRITLLHSIIYLTTFTSLVQGP